MILDACATREVAALPLYDFRCQECGHVFTELVAWEHRSEVRCPQCGGPADPQVSAFAIGPGSGGSSGAGRRAGSTGFS